MNREDSAADKIKNVLDGRSRFAVICDRVENVEPLLPNGCANLMPTDGPYHGVKSHGWDNEHKSDAAFLDWKRERYAAWKRILAPNGTLYDFASPQMGARVEVACREFFSVIGNIRWQKPKHSTKAEMFDKAMLRTLFPASETIVMAAQCDFVFEPLRKYFLKERARAKLPDAAIQDGMKRFSGKRYVFARHTFSQSQWELPTAEQYEAARLMFDECGDANGKPYLTRPYEELRTQYEELRRPFNVTPADQYTDVWTYPTVPYRKDKHPCEKPEAMARDIVRISSRPNDVVLVFFAGSGIFASEALKQGRRVIAVEADQHWAEVTEKRCTASIVLPDAHPAAQATTMQVMNKPSTPTRTKSPPNQLFLFA